MSANNFQDEYAPETIDRAGVDALPGVTVVEFGTNWCPICQGAQSIIRAGVTEHADLTHLKVEDGRGRPLGRSFRIKLWPTLVVLKDGVEVGRVVRPESAHEVRTAIASAY